MIISYGWTAQYLLHKIATRRVWKPKTIAAWQKAWDTRPDFLHTAVDKCLAYGGSDIGRIKLTDRPFLQPLSEMTEDDLIKEGGMVDTVPEFIDRYFDGDASTIVTVISFKFFPGTGYYKLNQERID